MKANWKPKKSKAKRPIQKCFPKIVLITMNSLTTNVGSIKVSQAQGSSNSTLMQILGKVSLGENLWFITKPKVSICYFVSVC